MVTTKIAREYAYGYEKGIKMAQYKTPTKYYRGHDAGNESKLKKIAR
jgi:hypothetical protein